MRIEAGRGQSSIWKLTCIGSLRRLRPLVEEIRRRTIRLIAIPPLGSGLGGLDRTVVRPRIEAALAPLDDVQVVIYEPPRPGSAAGMRVSG